MSIDIKLSEKQLHIAEQEARRRQSQNEERGLKGRNRAPAAGTKALEMHRLGCIGETAVAHYLGLEQFLFTHQQAMPGSSDLPGGIEVKTRSKHGYDLLVQLDDDPDETFVLVTHQGDTTRVIGWLRGYEAMKREYIRELVRGRPCYVVPQNKLRPLDELWQSPAADSAYGAEIESDGGELILKFPEALLERLDWKVGDTLKWEVCHETNTCVIRKVVNERSQDINNGQ